MSDFQHVLGNKNDELNFLPVLEEPQAIVKDARRNFNPLEKQALIDENGSASNRSKIDVTGTHYENSTSSEIALMIMPLKGL